MHMKEGDVAFDLRGAERMQAMAVLIQMSSSAAEHTFAQIGAPFLSMPVSFAPLALCGEFLIGPIPWAINCLDHSRDMAR